MMKLLPNKLFSSVLLTSTIVTVSMLSMLSVLTACGQKGALYLPNDSQTITTDEQQQDQHPNDDFLVPKINEQIEKGIEQMTQNPNDY